MKKKSRWENGKDSQLQPPKIMQTMPGMSGIPGMPVMSLMPGVPLMSGMPGMSGIPGMLGMPGMPANNVVIGNLIRKLLIF